MHTLKLKIKVNVTATCFYICQSHKHTLSPCPISTTESILILQNSKDVFKTTHSNMIIVPEWSLKCRIVILFKSLFFPIQFSHLLSFFKYS